MRNQRGAKTRLWANSQFKPRNIFRLWTTIVFFWGGFTTRWFRGEAHRSIFDSAGQQPAGLFCTLVIKLAADGVSWEDSGGLTSLNLVSTWFFVNKMPSQHRSTWSKAGDFWSPRFAVTLNVKRHHFCEHWRLQQQALGGWSAKPELNRCDHHQRWRKGKVGDIRANLPLPRAKPWNHGLEIAAAARRRNCPDFQGRVCVCGDHRDDISMPQESVSRMYDF